jgi:uncharacterized membrane protein HdeD (DUF308 family)/pimeloyl-ACP methyl ester carboxylesterase
VTARRVPWWFSLLVALACVLIGAYLIADPFKALSVLAAAVGVALLCSGAGELAAASRAQRSGLVRAAGVVWVLAGVLAIAWPGIALDALAALTGAALVLGGAAELRAAMQERGEQRALALAVGCTAAVAGVLALVWPSITVLALAVIVGVATVLFGCAALAAALAPLRAPQGVVVRDGRVLAAGAAQEPPPLPWAAVLAPLAVVLCGAGVSAALHQRAAPHPGPFYAAPARLPHGPPGTVIRYEQIPHFYPGAKTYRVLYKSTGPDGRPTAVSGLIVVPEGPPPRGGRKVIAFTHGAVGLAGGCAPSVQQPGDATQVIQGLGGFIAAGYVVAASDYEGLGTRGASPDLIGRAEAMDALDSVRAAHRLRAAHAGVQFAVWGHSEGGQAALFTAALAPSYAPGLRLAGVAAGAPVPDLVDLFRVALARSAKKAGAGEASLGRALVAMALASWQRIYGSARLGRFLSPAAQSALATITRYCLYGREPLAPIPGASLHAFSFRHSPPWGHQPWRAIAAANTPGQLPIAAPVLITQGGADRIVPPAITARLVRALCARGARVQQRTYESVGHAEAGIVAAPDVAAWVGERFAGQPAPTSCPA